MQLILTICSKKMAKEAARLRERERHAAEEAAKADGDRAPVWRRAFPKRLMRDFRAAADAETGAWGDAEQGAVAASTEAEAAAATPPM